MASRAAQRREPPSAAELDELTFGTRYNGPGHSVDVEAPMQENAAVQESLHSSSQPIEATQSLTSPSRNKFRFAAACVVFVQLGLTASAPGALLPYLEEYYSIDYTVVSLVFVANAVGYISAVFVTNPLHYRLGRAKVMALSMLSATVANTLLVCTPVYGLVVLSFVFSGLASAMFLALVNSYLAGLANATVLLGLCHASYGLGGVLGPLIATALVGSGHQWSVFYTLTLSLSVLNCAAAFLTFRGIEAESAAPDPPSQAAENIPRRRRLAPLSRYRAFHFCRSINGTSAGRDVPAHAKATIRKALKSRVVLLGAWFIFAYQGSEVTISGWVLSFLITSRSHTSAQNVSLGYVTSGFWAGMTLGRVALTHPAQRIGEKISVVILLAAVTLLQLVVWFVPNVIADAVAVGLVGLLLGPIYPCAMVVFSRLLNKNELVPALSVVTALGSSGGATGPFVTGVIGQRTGPWVLNPVVLGFVGLMLLCWSGLPRIPKRTR